MTAVLTKANYAATGAHSVGPDAYDSVAQMELRFQRVLKALIVRGYVRSGTDAIDMQTALNEGTPYALLHLCDVLLTPPVVTATAGTAPAVGAPLPLVAEAIAAPLMDSDLERVRKLRDKAESGGGTWQAWSRILEALELAKIAQDAVEEASVGGPD